MREGDRFGAYELKKRIGQGGMAEIFQARKHGAMGFNREVCIKLIRPALSSDNSFVEMFIDEANTSSKLRHSNIVAIDDFGELEGQLFACMEWVNGVDLGHLTKRLRDDNETMPTDVALFVVGEVLKALEYAHAKIVDGQALNIVHRDVTPSNVLVSYAGEVKLTDFGIAKASSRRHQTHGDVVKGKISYMAPEQARGLSLDHRVDLFALGVVSFELLAGRRPFIAAREADVATALVRNDRPALRTLRPELSPEIERFVDRLLAPSREARFASATAALDALSTIAPSTGARGLTNLLADFYPGQASVVRDGAALRKRAPTPVKAAPARASEATVELPAARAIPEKTVSEALPSMPTDPAPPPDIDPGEHTAVDQKSVSETELTDNQRPPSFDPPDVPSERMLLERARTDRVATATSARPHEPSDASRSAVTITTLQRVVSETPDAPAPVVPSEPPPEDPPRSRAPWLIAALVPLLVGVAGVLLTRRPPTTVVAQPTPPVTPAAEAQQTPTPPTNSVTPPTPPAPSATVDASAPATPEDAPALLTVVVDRWGSISVDGRSYGDSRASVRLAPGRHRVQATQPGNTRSETVVLRAGERRAIVIHMQ